MDAELAARFPGAPGTRQPVHTCYVPADRFGPRTAREWGAAALAALDAHAADPGALAAATGADPEGAQRTAAHVRRVLVAEPVQDLRIDAEDGYTPRPGRGERDSGAAEDRDVTRAAEAVLEAAGAGTLPRSYGLRPSSFDAATRERGVRTLDLFLTVLAAGGGPPPGLVVTLPKVSAPEQVTVARAVLAALEDRLGLPPTAIEVQVETPAAVLALPALVAAGRPRLLALPVGTYDYSAALGVAGAYQASDHPAVELATSLMQVATAGTEVRVVDGSCNLLPVGDRTSVRAGWARHAAIVRRAWTRGLYQGWDLHPAQLVSRHATVADLLLAGLPAAVRRLSAYRAAGGAAAGGPAAGGPAAGGPAAGGPAAGGPAAGAAGGVADEPASARALAGHVARALDAGLLSVAELAAAGLRPGDAGR